MVDSARLLGAAGGITQGVTYLLNWYPILAHHDTPGLRADPHLSPWRNPGTRRQAVRGSLRPPRRPGRGLVGPDRSTRPGLDRAGGVVTIVASPARISQLSSSPNCRPIRHRRAAGRHGARVGISFPEHKSNAKRILDFAAEVVPQFERWFGPYYDDKFEIAAIVFRLERQRVLRSGPARRPGDAAPLGRAYAASTTWSRARRCTSGSGTWSARTASPRPSTDEAQSRRADYDAARRQVRACCNAPMIVWPRGGAGSPTVGREGAPAGRLLRPGEPAATDGARGP